MRGVRSLVAVLLLLCSMVASAAPVTADELSRARAHFQAGQAMYELGRYAEAVHEFGVSYTLTHRPELILNIGSCYRKLGDPAAARDVFLSFLREASPQDPYRPQVVALLREIDAELAARAPVAPVVTPAPVVVVQEPVVAPVIVSAPQPPPRSFARRHWWIFPVVGAVVVAGAAVGIYFGAREASRPDCGSTTLGCIHP